MKILELAYEDKATGWKLNPVQFSDLNSLYFILIVIPFEILYFNLSKYFIKILINL